LKFGKSKLERGKERKRKSNEEPTTSKRFCARSIDGELYASTHVDMETNPCVFLLFQTRNFKRSARFNQIFRVRKCVHEIPEEDLLEKLGAGDLIALEAKYHGRCLTNLFNRARGEVRKFHVSQMTQHAKVSR